MDIDYSKQIPEEKVLEIITKGDKIKASIKEVANKLKRWEGVYALWLRLSGTKDGCLYIGESDNLRRRLLIHHRFNDTMTDLHNRFERIGIFFEEKEKPVPFIKINLPDEMVFTNNKETISVSELQATLEGKKKKKIPKYEKNVWFSINSPEEDKQYYINYFELSNYIARNCYWTVCYLLQRKESERRAIESLLIRSLDPLLNRIR